jgi:hypothetical protein
LLVFVTHAESSSGGRRLCSRALSFAPTIQNEGPGLDCSQTPGPRCAVPWQAIVQALYACRPRVLSSARGDGLGTRSPPSYRLYHCRRCGVQVRICRRCDHGQIYCAGECSRIRRRESLRRAGARYQRSRRGAARHAARQRAWRGRRRAKVTHQGWAARSVARKVSGYPLTVAKPDANCAATADFTVRSSAQRLEWLSRCSFCAVVLPAWTRWRRWAWSG